MGGPPKAEQVLLSVVLTRIRTSSKPIPMAELSPLPFPLLLTRMLREWRRHRSIFDLPQSKFFLGSPSHDLSVPFHHHRPASPLGPAAGPHTQMAQNIVLAWLGGSRIIELKTVQILDQLKIPRPCIDMRNVGFNIEWSQELRIEQSLEEYVKASMLIDILKVELAPLLQPNFTETIFDLSVGYDLKGIQSPTVHNFIQQMMNAKETVARLTKQIPEEFTEFHSLPFTTRIADSLTLSTFHGCPPSEIQQIIEHLQDKHHLHCIVKLNPTLLGPQPLRTLLHDQLGYTNLHVPDTAFTNDPTWNQATAFTEHLQKRAQNLNLGFGIKLTNTLIVNHDTNFLPPSEKQKYLSGPPLHILALHLVHKFRSHFGPELPLSFSAGINRHNFPDAVALGLTPITVCSDLLHPGGYTRQTTYYKNLLKQMDAVGATTIEQFIINTSEADNNSDAIINNTNSYTKQATNSPRYSYSQNSGGPKKVGSHLELFNCLTCDKCLPVCPNHANFRLTLPPREIPITILTHNNNQWSATQSGTLTLHTKHQIANLADFCNDCGNCDIFCPEDGGPYLIKPRFFSTHESWQQSPTLDGFHLSRDDKFSSIHARINSVEYSLTIDKNIITYSGPDFSLTFNPDTLLPTLEGLAESPVDLTYYHIMNLVQEALYNPDEINYLNCE